MPGPSAPSSNLRRPASSPGVEQSTWWTSDLATTYPVVAKLTHWKADFVAHANAWLTQRDPEALLQRAEHRWRVMLAVELMKEVTGTVLDIGCFAGILGDRVRRQGNGELIGVDMSEMALRMARSRGITPVVSDAEWGLPFRDERYDCVMLLDVLQHSFDPDGVIAEAARVLKPAGRIVLTVPNLHCLNNRIRFLLGRAPHQLGFSLRGFDDPWVTCFTADSIGKTLAKHGLLVKQIKGDVVLLPKRGSRWAERASSRLLARGFPTLTVNLLALAKKPPDRGSP